MTLLIANVLESNRDYGGLLREAARTRPDLILALETDEGWRRALAPLERDYPHVVAQAQDNTYGLMLYSRLPLERTQVRFLLEDDVPSIRTGVVLPSGERFTFHGVHPRPPHPGHSSAPRDAELVLVAREVDREDGPTVVAGDLNDVAWSDTTRLSSRSAACSIRAAAAAPTRPSTPAGRSCAGRSTTSSSASISCSGASSACPTSARTTSRS